MLRVFLVQTMGLIWKRHCLRSTNSAMRLMLLLLMLRALFLRADNDFSLLVKRNPQLRFEKRWFSAKANVGRGRLRILFFGMETLIGTYAVCHLCPPENFSYTTLSRIFLRI